jgi:hypothetical protein
MESVKKDDRVKIWHQLDREGEFVIGRVTEVSATNAGWIKAEIENSSHELHKKDDGSKRIITVSPDLYEVIF